MKVDAAETPTTILTQIGIADCLPKTARGDSRGEFGLNKNHGSHNKKALAPTNVGDPGRK